MADRTLIYAGAISFSKGTGGLWRKEAEDDQWQELEGNGLPHRPEVFNVSIHPNDPSQVYLGTDTGLYLSRDSGDQWGKLALKEGEIPFAIAFHPSDPRIIAHSPPGWKNALARLNPDVRWYSCFPFSGSNRSTVGGPGRSVGQLVIKAYRPSGCQVMPVHTWPGIGGSTSSTRSSV